MSDPFIGEIKMVGFNFAPVGWAQCNGQLLPISQNSALFSLLGTIYGGDGRTTFALPDLRSRVPVHMGQGTGLSNYNEGQQGGTETVTLTQNQMPSHTHTAASTAQAASICSSGKATTGDPSKANSLGDTDRTKIYSSSAPKAGVGPSITPSITTTIANTGGSQSHENMMPYLTINFCIALTGIFPSRN